MNGRELVILLLGLAIVAVVLRGLYVAINARRGQIKLAIDKNIPQNVDLESLELAELPGGGARVVTRSLEEVNRQNNALDIAETKARSLNLADAEDDGHIPVLMDAVELSEPVVTSVNSPREQQQEAEIAENSGSETAFAETPVVAETEVEKTDVVASEVQNTSIEEDAEEGFHPSASQEHSIGEDWEDVESDADAETDTEGDYGQLQEKQELLAQTEDDSEQFDYDEEELEEDDARNNVDTMSSIAPDYSDESESADEVEELNTENSQISDNDSYEDSEESYFDDELGEQAELSEQEFIEEGEQEQEQQPAPFDADGSVDEFSMTAGERIGGNPPPVEEASQSGLFDDIDENTAEVEDKPKGLRSLFTLFGRKSKQGRESIDAEEAATPAADTMEMDATALDEPEDVLLDDVLFEERSVAVDVGEAEHEESAYIEPEYAEPVVDDELIDELDQKRAASIESEAEEQKSHSDEFEHSEVLVLNVTAKDGRVFSGDDLLQVLITSGLKFGDMNIFHKRLSKEHQGTVIFSVANMLNPGTFDLNNMDEFTTLGISFFLALPTAINNLDAFEQMLGVAQEIRDTLGGDLKDDHRNGMTGQTIEHYRQRIRDFELRRLKAVAARG